MYLSGVFQEGENYPHKRPKLATWAAAHALIVEGFSRICPESQNFAHNSPNSTRDCQPNAFTCRTVTSLLGSFLVRVTFVISCALAVVAANRYTMLESTWNAT